MESETPAAGSVNRFARKSRDFLSGKTPPAVAPKRRITRVEIRDRRTIKLFIRILGYLHGAFVRKSNGRLHYLDWNADRFSKKTKREYSVRHLERMFPRFQRWCSEYHFTRVNIGGRWRVRITLNPYVHVAVPGSQIRERLHQAILSHVAKSGRSRIDLEFCRKFSEISSLPLNGVEHVWSQIKKFAGLRGRWRGRGRGRNFAIEDPARWEKICAERAEQKTKNLTGQTRGLPPRSAFLRNDKIKNGGPGDRSPEDSPRAAPALGNASDTAGRVGGTDAEPGGSEHPGPQPYFGRWFPGCNPVQFCGRIILPRKLLALANWIAGQKLKFVHDAFPRVEFRFPHARNFALAAVRFGYAVPAIIAAWERGVAQSHADAADANELEPRPPSAAKVYAWLALRAADPRTPEELWAEFFARPRRGLEPKPARKPAATPRKYTKPRSADDIISRAAMLEKLRAVVEPAPRAATPEITLGELAEFLKLRDLTIAKYNAMPYPRRKFLLEKAAAFHADKKSRDA